AGVILVGCIGLSALAGASAERSRTWVHVVAIGIAVFAAVTFFERAVTALEQRTEIGLGGGEAQRRFWGALIEAGDLVGAAGLGGHGSGISQPAVRALRKVLHLPDAEYEYYSPTDAENSRVLFELGVPGFLMWYGMRIGLVIALWQTRRRLNSPYLRQVALGG